MIIVFLFVCFVLLSWATINTYKMFIADEILRLINNNNNNTSDDVY